MEAIIELLAAAIIGIIIIPIQIAAALLGFVLEFVFMALTEGLTAASKKFHQRRETQRESVAQKKDALQQRRATRKEARRRDEVPTSVKRLNTAVIVGMVVLVIVSIGVGLVLAHHVRKQRIARTQTQIDKLADQFIAQIQDEDTPDPQEGLLAQRDAWHQPLELFLDEALLGSMVVVRSSGPDRQSGTIDDLLAIRMTRAPAKKIGAELVDRAVDKIRDGVKKFLPGNDDEEEPEPATPE